MANPPAWTAWLWPLSASLEAGEAVLHSWGQLVDQFSGTELPVGGPEPSWTTRHKIALELPTDPPPSKWSTLMVWLSSLNEDGSDAEEETQA